MSEITLFGRCEMNAKTFAAMPSHMQTEALRLMADRQHDVVTVEKVTGVPRSGLMQIFGARHQIKLKDEDRSAPPKGPRIGSLSGTARLILLQMQDQAGALASSLSSLSYDLGKSTTSVRDALKQLVTRELIELTVPARGTRHPAEYRVTAAGEALALELGQSGREEAPDA